ncbi:MAG: gliding motility-associated C-terminal domain-containing protein, partial [Saprospiraceae bacterium]
GIHLDTFKTMDGCDSVRTVQLNVIACEPECGVVIGSIYGDPDLNETADCLAATPEKDGMYVAGVRNQQVILMKLDLKGIVIWSKVFDAVQNKPEFVNCIMVDSDGHILLSGIAGPAQVSQGGTIYALKYDPIAHQVLWSKEFTTHSQNYNNSIIQKGVGGNYLLSNNPHLGFTDDEEIIELDINTGAPVPSNTRNYSLMGSESVNLLYHEGFVYGVGRYTSNAATEFMRHTIVKIDPDDGSQLWVRMGHIGPDDYARLYGVQMVIDLDEIYSCYSGDPNGTSLSTTKMFVQKTSTSGTLRWVKQYDLPGDNDAVYAITKSGNGLVLLAGQNNNSPGLNLFKIDTDGNIVWSKKIDFDTYVNATPGSKAISKLIEVGNILAFTSISRNASGEDDIFIGRTDLNGESDIPCLTIQSASILVINISNPQFYSVSPTHTNSSSQSKSASLNVSDADVVGKEECIIADTLYSTIVHSMCTGEIYEGYMDSGTYVDQFTSGGGCDSIRTLILDVGLPSVFPVVSFCEGSSFESYDQGGFYVDTIPGIIGCYTVRHLTLIETPVIQTTLDVTICSGAEYSGYNTEGIYTDTFQTTAGCDSVRTLHLSVMSEIMTNQDFQICLGDVYEGYFQDGVYIDTLQSIFGCDSIRHLQLMIVPEEKFINVDVCTGGSFEHYSLPGQYIDTIQGSTSACDTIRHITLVLLPAEKTNISYTICAEDHFNGHTEPGEYSDTLTAADGCITIQTVMLSVREPITSYVEASLCDGLVPGHHVPGIIIDTLISFLGCDSIRTLLLEGPPRYIPNVFTPNNDGNNDIFEIFTSTDSHLDLDYFAIFDRFGDMTYETSAWPVLWDGNRVNGQPHQSGVYAYILIYECGGERIIEHGNITLVK